MNTVQLDGNDVVVTDHAVERFVERYRMFEEEELDNPLARLQTVIADAQQVQLPPKLEFKRLINHRGKKVTYYQQGRWRFVLTTGEDPQRLLTVEWDIERPQTCTELRFFPSTFNGKRRGGKKRRRGRRR